jgi:hypothetical protein
VGFETTIAASEQAKTVHALERSATVTGIELNNAQEINSSTKGPVGDH